ncbi:MAG: hypothetical protein CMH63_00185 [Nanoarchaeota archaeon]|jgi:hypothetical protein|nr:hypothetical protein [Nanoarchaeota archaeon]|tara:strand:+ start:39056 stop:39628 length:573 start_codon:yes stop_codon:yes gene_type:complete
MANDENFKENVINSFKKMKEDVLRLENMILSLKQGIAEIKAQKPIESSTGNKGVLSKQASEQASKRANNQALVKQSEDIKGSNDDIETHFRSLTKQEFLIFLSLYQLQEEMEGPVKFIDLANYMKLSEGCIRAYVYKLIAKGTPIHKEKANNRIVNLSVSAEFRALNLKKRLTDLFYEIDSSQKRISDQF